MAQQRNLKSISIRLEPELYEKLKFIAYQERRFLSRQIVYWVRLYIRDYEHTHGEIWT